MDDTTTEYLIRLGSYLVVPVLPTRS